jgi:small subunit ribosomal protein S20
VVTPSRRRATAGTEIRGLPRCNHHQDTPKRLFVANIKSQIKRIKTNEKARQRNQSVKSSLKTAIRKAREAVEAGDQAKAQELARAASRQLDKAVSKGVIHANQAANKKSALTKKVNDMAA